MDQKGVLADRIAVVTGGNRGIGAAIATSLAQAGARVNIGARSVVDSEEAQISSHSLDVGSSDSVSAFIAWVERTSGSPDILVNAAGITAHHLVEGHDEVLWQNVIDINLNGPFRMIRAVLPSMKAAERGVIVNIASTAARTAVADHPAYCASKSGLVGLTRAVALEGAPHGITCVAVSPSWVETDMLRASAATMAAASGRTTADEIAAMAAANPQNRFVQPGEVAELVTFICSRKVPGLTMEDIQISGGAFW